MDKVIKILTQEVEWHQKNPDKAKDMSVDWIDGFNKGCEHCLAILIKCEDAVLIPDAADTKQRCVTIGCNNYVDTTPRKHCNACLGR